MPLAIAVGHATNAGPRAVNEDFVGIATPDGDELARMGVLAAIADGVSGEAGGGEAAEYTVRGLLADYYATPDTWATTVALDRVLNAINRWVIAQAQSRRDVAGMATTLTAILLRGRRAVLAHVGDTRCYRVRDAWLERLTTDHVWDRPDMAHVLTRAIGLDAQLRIDYSDTELVVGDRFALVSDGVWATLQDEGMGRTLAAIPDAQAAADRLVQRAIEAGTQDNASAIVLDVRELPEDALADVLSAAAALPVPALAKVGDTIDGFKVEQVLHKSVATMVYRVIDEASGRVCVLKTLAPERANDPLERRQLAHEEWIARRVVARFFPQVIAIGAERRSALYYVQTWHAGKTLGAALATGAHLTVPEILAIAIKLCRGVGALHRRSVIHRDIKPENVHLGDDGEVRILDFGVAESSLAAGVLSGQAGTPSYLAPELFENGSADYQTDLYALGVTLYHALTRRYPYGEIEPFQHPKFGEPIAASRYRPETPGWLDAILAKLVARDRRGRFETAEELLLALERGAAHPVSVPATPILARDPLAFWRLIAVLSLTVNLLLIYVLVVVK